MKSQCFALVMEWMPPNEKGNRKRICLDNYISSSVWVGLQGGERHPVSNQRKRFSGLG